MADCWPSSEKAYNTINDSPEAVTFSWEILNDPCSCDWAQPHISAGCRFGMLTQQSFLQLETELYRSCRG